MTYFNGDNETADAEDVEEEESIFETSVATEDSDIRSLNNDFQLMNVQRVNGVLQIGSIIYTAPDIDNLPPPPQVFPPPPLPNQELPPPAQEELPPPLPDIEPEEQEQELPPPPAPRRRETNPKWREYNARRSRRRNEKNKFQDFYDSLDKDEYTSTEIVQEYNTFYNLEPNQYITHKGFGRLNEVKSHFNKSEKVLIVKLIVIIQKRFK